MAAGLLRIESVRYEDDGEDGVASFDVTREGRLRFFNRHRDNVWMVFDEYGFPRGAGPSEKDAWFSIKGPEYIRQWGKVASPDVHIEKIKQDFPGYTCKRVHMQPALSPDEVKEQGETVRAFFALY